jgi:hypothetical protein
MPLGQLREENLLLLGFAVIYATWAVVWIFRVFTFLSVATICG